MRTKKWEVNCVRHFNGMFAFVIYDIKTIYFFGARDRRGEKPLKYFLMAILLYLHQK